MKQSCKRVFGVFILLASLLVVFTPSTASADSGRFENSCLDGNGRVDFFMTNTLPSPRNFELILKRDGHRSLHRTSSVAGNQTVRRSITGRADGVYRAEIGFNLKTSNPVVLAAADITVACDVDPPTAPPDTATAAVSCVNGKGQIKVTINNNSTERRTYKAHLNGGNERTVTTNGGQSTTASWTNLNNGTHTVWTSHNGHNILDTTKTVNCNQPAPPPPPPPPPSSPDTATAAVSCVNGKGQIKVTVKNNSPDKRTYNFVLGASSETHDVNAYSSHTKNWLSQEDGTYQVRVHQHLETNQILDVYRTINCAIATPDSATAAASCVSGKGQIKVTIKNNSTEHRTYKAHLNGGNEKTVSTNGGQSTTASWSNLGNGTHKVWTSHNGHNILDTTKTVNCNQPAPPVTPDKATAAASCNNGGEIVVNIKNNSTVRRTYKAHLNGGNEKTVSANGGQSTTASWSALDNGTHKVWTSHNNHNILDTTVTVNCNQPTPDIIEIKFRCEGTTPKVEAFVKNNSAARTTYGIGWVNGSSFVKIGSATIEPGASMTFGGKGISGLRTWQVRVGSRVADQVTHYSDCGCALPSQVHPDLLMNQTLIGHQLNLPQTEARTNIFNGNNNHIVIQSIFDPVVRNKKLIVDEYSLTFKAGPGFDSVQELKTFMATLAADMDGVLGGDFASQGDFKNQGSPPVVGQVIDIDVKGDFGGVDPVYINAPVIITHIEESCFGVKTIEYNSDEHILHGDRRWGFEILNHEPGNFIVRFHTTGISVPDRFYSQAKKGEKKFWTAWSKQLVEIVEDDGGEIIQGSVIANQQNPSITADQMWQTLSASDKAMVKNGQIYSHSREVDWLQRKIDVTSDSLLREALEIQQREHEREIADWHDIPG